MDNTRVGRFDTPTILLIVFVSLAMILSIVAIVLVSIYLSKGTPTTTPNTVNSINTATAATRKTYASSSSSYPAPVRKNVPRGRPSPSKIIKTPSKLLAQIKTTPLDVSGMTDKLYVIDDCGVKRRLIPSITEPVIDIADLDEGLLVLLNYGNLMYLTHDDENLLEYQLPATENITQLASFNGEVIGLHTDGRLFIFDFEDEDHYSWRQIIPSVKTAAYISSPQDGSCLWIQTNKESFCYDTTLDIVSREPLQGDSVRIFGESLNEFITINRSSLIGEGTLEKIENVYDGTFLNQEFVRISYDHYIKGVVKVKCIDGQLYYIIRS
jgi:hypothetical protein